MAIISKELDPGTAEPPLASFALAWRWRGTGRHPLPPDAMARLRVLPAAQARMAFRISSGLLGTGGLDRRRFALRQRDTVVEAAGQPVPGAGPEPRAPRVQPAPVTLWLRDCQPAMKTPVWLSWEPELALYTRWGVFVRHWDAFCYPGSDDLVVFPA